MRLESGDIAFSIYRKPCHAGNYIHAYSYQPLSQKWTVIRNMFLRAYRYCNSQFLKEEELRIQQDFLKLGYTTKYIEECRVSAYKGRTNEVKKENLTFLQELPFAENKPTKAEKKEPLATLTLPYHPCMEKLKPRLAEMGVRLAYSTNSALGQELTRKSQTRLQPDGTVYVANCTLTSCPEVYIGQTGRRKIEDRMDEHQRGPQSEKSDGAVFRHNQLTGHHMDLQNPTKVFKSDCYNTRVTVEAALIHVAPTVQGNTATACVSNDELVAPVICRSTRFDWPKLAECIPHLRQDAVQKHKRNLFGNPRIVRPHPTQRSQAPSTPVARRTRSQQQSRSSILDP